MALAAVESIETKRSILGVLLRYGTITVRGGGGSRTPVYLVDSPKRFRTEALRLIATTASNAHGGHVDPSMPRDLSPSPTEDLTLGHTVILVPAIPKPIFEELWKHSLNVSSSEQLVSWRVRDKEIVKGGDVIAEFLVRPTPNSYYGHGDDKRPTIGAQIKAACVSSQGPKWAS
jgi:hypothetical protein